MNRINKRQSPGLFRPIVMKTILTLLLALGFHGLQAAEIMGAYISYVKWNTTQVDLTYRITVAQADSLLSTSDFTAVLSCPTSGKQVTINNLIINGKKPIYPYCSPATFVWEFEFIASIDFGTGTYSILAGCCNLRAELSASSRNLDINTLKTPSSGFYIYTEFENCNTMVNSSPVSEIHEFVPGYLNVPNAWYAGMFDTVDFDSLSFELVDPLSKYGTTVAWGLNLHADQPLTCAYYGGKSYPDSDPDASPPIGFYFDQITGISVFTPTAGEKGPMVIKVTEWRLNSSLNYYQISEFIREMYVRIDTVWNNNPPEIKGLSSYKVKAGNQLCFDMTTEDKVFVPPPPATAPPPDSVRLSWDHSIAGATFTIINPGARLQTGRFCWTPDQSDVSTIPYSFTVTARDNSCPINTITTRLFTVKVESTAGIDDPVLAHLNLYPNPATSLLYSEVEIDYAEIYNFRGELVAHYSQTTEMDIGHLASGIYLIRVQIGDAFKTMTFVVE